MLLLPHFLCLPGEPLLIPQPPGQTPHFFAAFSDFPWPPHDAPPQAVTSTPCLHGSPQLPSPHIQSCSCWFPWGWGYIVSYSPFGFQLCIEHPRGMEKVNVHATLSSLVSAALKWMITCRTWSMLGPRGTQLFSNTPFLQSFPLQILGGHATVQKHSVAL